jgi:hypothetical protein
MSKLGGAHIMTETEEEEEEEEKFNLLRHPGKIFGFS